MSVYLSRSALFIAIATSSFAFSAAQAEEVEAKVFGSLSAKGHNQADFPKLAKLSAKEAAQVATTAVPGNMISIGLENEDGFLVYAVEVASSRSGMRELLVDAGNGKVLANQSKGQNSEGDGDGEQDDD